MGQDPLLAPLEEREDTVTLDTGEQDKLMRLRAQQDSRLRQTFAGHLTVMFTDLVGSTSYYERYGDLAGRQKMLSHNALLFPIIRTNGGTIVKTMGDGLMACFAAEESALTAAEAMQQALGEFNSSVRSHDEEIHIRVGVNAGPAIAEEGDLHGDAVNVAARVQARAGADEVLVTGAVVRAAPGRGFEAVGSAALKGKVEPVEIFRLVWRAMEVHSPRVAPRLFGTRYRLGQPLGRGPLGVVWAAEDVRLRVPVAVKTLHAFIGRDPGFAEAFLERVQTMASLLHPHVVRVLDCSADWIGEPYYITERIDGRDLGAWVLRNGLPDLRRAARLVTQIGAAIGHGHRHGVVHGNLKPENVLIRTDGLGCVCDFGLASFPQHLDLVRGSPLMPPAFQAPEQVLSQRPDPRTDVYSLGAILYFLLAGRPPYESAATLRAQQAVASGLYKRLDRIRGDLPVELVAISEKAMAAAPGDRYPSVEELGEALTTFADGWSAGRADTAQLGDAPPP